MADLHNLLLHMRGGVVRVNGTNYPIDMDGIAKDVRQEDAEKLLLGNAWEIAKPSEMEPESQLLDDDGEPITDDGEDDDGKDVLEPDESMDIDELRAMADRLEVAYGANIGKALLIERIKEAMGEEPSDDDE